MNWIIIVVLIVLAFLVLRMRHVKHKIYMSMVIIILLFVYITASHLLASQELSIKSSEDWIRGAKIYFSWFGSITDNFKDIAGRVVKMDWKLNQTAEQGEIS